jgi:hypothetical protein
MQGVNDMIDIKNCPMCLMDYKEYPALSRRDNKTEICSACGKQEAMIDYHNRKLKTPESITKDEQLMILESLNQSLVIDYVWDNYTDDCVNRFNECSDNYHYDDDYSSDRD